MRVLKFLIFLFICVIIFSVILYLTNYYKKRDSNSTSSNKENVITPTDTEKNTPPKEDKDTYKIEWLIVRQLDNVALYSNLEEKLTTEEIVNKYLCQSLVSGSFYSKENTHIGLFISDNKRVSDVRENVLFNSFFYITSNAVVIDQTPPTSARLALQSGPLLLKNGKPLNLELQNDNNERRIAVATLRDGNIAFIIVYSNKSHFQGPKLAELPEILNNLQKNTSLKFKEALNLDGGTAAAFITENIKLPELSRIGSFFCIK